MSGEIVNSKKVVFIKDNKVKTVLDTDPVFLQSILDNDQLVDITAFENALQINVGDLYDPTTNTITVIEVTEVPAAAE